MGQEAGARATRVRQETKKKKKKTEKKSKIKKKAYLLSNGMLSDALARSRSEVPERHTAPVITTTTIVRDFHIGIIESPVLL